MSDAVLAARSSNIKLVFFTFSQFFPTNDYFLLKKGFYSSASKYSYVAYDAANAASNKETRKF